MKKLFILIFSAFTLLSVNAQTSECRKPTFRPDWTYSAPAPGNATYLYVVEHGEGNTKREALNQAIGRVFQSTANRIGQFVNTAEINRAIQAGTDYEVISRNMNIPINKVCEFAMQDPVDFTWTMYILCQVAKSGNISPEFETCTFCTQKTIYDDQKAKYEQCLAANKKAHDDAIKKANRKENAVALVSSMFVPGVGQMKKGYIGEGTGILLSELALVGGGTATYFVAKKQLDILHDNSISYDKFNSAKKKYNTMRILTYSCYGTAAALYIFNLCRAYMLKPRNKSYSIYPTIIPSDESNYAMGVGLTLNL